MSLSLVLMGMKWFKQWGSTTSSNLRSHVLISTCHSVSDMSITIVLNFFYIYLYILCTKSVCFFKLDKKSLWGCESFHKSHPCRLPHSSTEKCLVFVISLFLFVPQCLILLSQVSNTSRFLSTSPLEKGEGGEEEGVISSVYSVVSQRHPDAQARLGFTPQHTRGELQSERKQIRRWGFVS